MIATVLHVLDTRKEARNWFAAASRATQESGDRQLHAWVLAREAMVPINCGAPQAATLLAEQARQTAGWPTGGDCENRCPIAGAR
ncbi:hypothetical protein ACFRH6_25175 [Streptomyces sp. NPDC056749]|uniref:hypothetical protein n=1 Tax=Streptomyces sp. NPDC056749 TaxID=3345936 RepID=UPI003688EA4E